MARIENVNIDGTDYDVGKIASTSNLGVVQVGSGLSITPAGVLSATGGETMPVTFSITYTNDGYDWSWSSDYTYAQLAANPKAIRIYADEWCLSEEGEMTPDHIRVLSPPNYYDDEIELVVDYLGTAMYFYIVAPQEVQGQTVNQAYVDISKYVKRNRTELIILPTLELADYATSIPDGTTIQLTSSQNEQLYGSTSSGDCYPYRGDNYGNFMVLPVKRKVGSGSSYWATENCLLTGTVKTGTSGVSNDYVFKTFMFNGEHYKMTLTTSSYPNYTYTITKIATAPVFTLQTTDPGEGVALAANHFIGVYE